MRDVKRTVTTTFVVVALLACAVGAVWTFGSAFMENRAADRRFNAAKRAAEAGDGTKAADELVAGLAAAPEAGSFGDRAALLRLLESLPEKNLTDLASRPRKELDAEAEGGLQVLAGAAVLNAYPKAKAKSAATSTLVSYLNEGDHAGSGLLGDDTEEIALDAVATLDDDASLKDLFPETRDWPLEGFVGYRVLARMGPAGWNRLAKEVGKESAGVSAASAYSEAGPGVVPFLDKRLRSKSADARKLLSGVLAGIAISDERRDAEDAAKVLRRSVKDPAIAIGGLDFYVAEGDGATVPYLVKGLNALGTQEDAERFLNCGNKDLEKAAKTWATQNGYDIKSMPGNKEDTWGSGR